MSVPDESASVRDSGTLAGSRPAIVMVEKLTLEWSMCRGGGRLRLFLSSGGRSFLGRHLGGVGNC